MTTRHAAAYRAIVRVVNKASIYPRATRPSVVTQHIRAIFEQPREDKEGERFYRDMRNAATFMHSQEMHKTLLERYNPLLGLSTEDHLKKTAHRVGLDMPLAPKDEE
ncbi:hypothetical protein L226DRAFT_571277 [Lentinus tigrinus ALCF2SS1-7]|uniref:Uncharacterized protein n=1 Tax=Lentinus tigrinus ALCF2SS1-6 TaxID=1328759 RepID=A0A5C2SDM8_9APHY|nr:hypothetical protein L227DRAFT_599855 [Lentinus tigrinus ALCF2SS1-6]RPD74367.1 hypothetical protein L226DRAFT_571277 [Lentinus tigrinus ALCF2SS1-7]